MDIIPFEDDKTILHEFVAECGDMIAEVEQKIISLTAVIKEAQVPDLEDINAIFRLFHTIKGTSGFLNLMVMQEVAHEAESLLDAIRKGERLLTLRHIELFISAVDFLKAVLPVVEETGCDSSFSEQAEDQIMLLQSVAYEEEEQHRAEPETVEIETELYLHFPKL